MSAAKADCCSSVCEGYDESRPEDACADDCSLYDEVEYVDEDGQTDYRFSHYCSKHQP
jgi:hypothetical protein